MPVLLLLFIIMPIIEITVLIQVGSVIGVLSTVAIVVLTAILGSAMLRHQGLATLAKARQRMDQGEMPAQELVEGLLLVIGGVLLLTPGFVTDAMGFLCLIPATRHLIASRLGQGALMHLKVSGGPARGFGSQVAGRQPPRTVGESASAAAAAQAEPAVNSSTAGGGSPAGQAAPGSSSATDRAADSGSRPAHDAIDADFRRLD